VSADERPVCGAAKRDGTPCQYRPADRCPTHRTKASTGALPAVAVPAKTGGPGNPHDPVVKEAAAVRLARGEGVSAVAAALGLAHQTVSDWKRDPAFRDDVRRLRGELLDELSGTMAADGKALWDTVKAATRGEVKVPQGRLALDALKAIPAFREAVVLEDELDELRRKLDELTGDDDGGW
jgi:hypothetical protein